MKSFWWGSLLIAGCAPVDRSPAVPVGRWVTLETQASRLNYPAGDGSVSGSARVLVLAAASGVTGSHRPLPAIELPARVEVGEIFHVGIRIPRAREGDVRTLRIRGGRPGLRLIDPATFVVAGRKSVTLRAIADSAGPATFEIEDLTD